MDQIFKDEFGLKWRLREHEPGYGGKKMNDNPDIPHLVKDTILAGHWRSLTVCDAKDIKDAEVVIPSCYDWRDLPIGISDHCFDWMYTDDINDEVYYITNDNISTIFVSDGISYLCPGAFSAMFSLTSVYLPSTLVYVGEGAFYMSGITDVVFPNSVIYVGERTFSGCEHLSNCILSRSLTTISEETFECCSNLKGIDIPPSVTKIANRAFCGTGLQTVAIPEGLQRIESKAFASCKELCSVTLPRSVSYIARDAFDSPLENQSLTFYVHPNSYGWFWARKQGYWVKSATLS